MKNKGEIGDLLYVRYPFEIDSRNTCFPSQEFWLSIETQVVLQVEPEVAWSGGRG